MKKFLLCFCLCLLVLGCSSPIPEKKELRLAIQSSPATLDPRKSSDFLSSTLISLLFEGLTRCVEGDGVEPALAEKIEISSDGKTYTFFLRASSWSDGTPVTAEDFAQSWKMILHPDFPSPSAYLLYPIKNGEKFAQGEVLEEEVGIRTLSSHVLEIELERATPHFLSLTAFPLLLPASSHRFNGPFILAEENLHSSLILKKNPFYWNEQAIQLDEVIVSIVPNESTALHLFQKGELDWIGAPLFSLSSEALEALEQEPSLSFHPTPASTFCAFNTKREPFNRPSIRKAFSLATNQEKIVSELVGRGGIAAKRALPPLFLEGPPLYPFDPAAAKQLLEKELKENGPLPPITLFFRSTTTEKRIAQTLQEEWKKHLGVTISLQQMDGKTHSKAIQQGTHQIAITSWIAQYHDPLNLLERFKDLHFKNPTGWTSSRYQTLLEKSTETSQEEHRRALFLQAEEILAQEVPIAPLYHWTNPSLQHPRIEFLPFTANGGILFEKIKIDSCEKLRIDS